MIRVKLLVCLMLVPAALWSAGQQPLVQPAAGSDWVRKVFELKYADPRDVANLIGVFGYPIGKTGGLHAIAVTAPPQGIAAVEDAIRKVDVPAAAPQDVDLTVYMLIASEQAATGESVPAALNPVIAQLKGVFQYKGFHLLDTLLLRGALGERMRASGIVALTPASMPEYEFVTTPVRVTESATPDIRLNGLQYTLMKAGHPGLSTNITVHEGQKVVVGKSNISGPEQALILVVTAKLVQ